MPNSAPLHRPGGQTTKRTPHKQTTAYRRRYGRKWEDLRDLRLAKEPLCRECAKYNLVVGATQVDHIVPISEGGTNKLENTQSLCASCHSKKTRKESAND